MTMSHGLLWQSSLPPASRRERDPDNCRAPAGGRMTDVMGTLEMLRRQGLYREPRVLESGPGSRVIVNDAEVILLCSNDYLGLAGHPMVRAAAAEAARQFGAGSGASRLVSGTLTPHRQLEAELARFKGHEACLVFGSGYLANIGVISALAGPGDVILSDALNHASIVDGCRLARAETIVYEHRDLDSLAAGLDQAEGRHAVIITDAVFSMDGDVAPLRDIVDLARHHRARVIVDEAHATGVVGPGGRGLVAALGLESEVDVVVGTLSKALGSYGAFACCEGAMAQFLVNRARTFIYSTALPPPAVAAARAALRVLQDAPEIVDRLRANARTLSGLLAAGGLPVTPTDIPIIPIITGDPRRATALSEQALRDGVFARAIRPPTVPAGTSRLRLVATASHTEHDLREAARSLTAAMVQG
jgi:8-amino-7-oxononanoate synthase